MRNFLQKTLVSISILAFSYSVKSQSVKKKDIAPNVIIILMDDMGYGDPGCYNGYAYHTPNINKLAAEGMRFTNYYSAQAVCTASRAGLLTGCYPNRLGISGAFYPWSKIALNPKEETIAAVLKKVGYHTGMVGKWHLGSKPEHLPLNYGFDEYLGLPYSNDMWPVNYDGKPITDTASPKYKYPPLPLLQGDRPVQFIRTLEDQGTLTGRYTRQACDFIQQNKNQPFFLYLAHSMVHVPIAASPSFLGKSGIGLFGDVMMEVDWSIGEIMKALKANKLDDHTLVIFTSDNGPWLTFGDHAGNTGGLREGKGSSWEGGQRVPCIIRWPGKVPAGTISSNITTALDFLPTIANLAKAPLPKNKIDGVDIMPVLTMQPGANPRDEFAYYYQHNSLEAVRKGKWKLVLAHRSQTYKTYMPGQNGFPGGYADFLAPEALYDISHDPGETLDVQKQHPEIMKEMKVLVEKYRSTLGDDITKMPCTECREAAPVKF